MLLLTKTHEMLQSQNCRMSQIWPYLDQWFQTQLAP